MRNRVIAAIAPLVLVLAACGSDSVVEPEPTPNIVQVAQAVNAETGEFSVLIAAVVRAGLVDELSTGGPYTVFAPTDAAFGALGLDAAGVTGMPVAELTAILLYHVVPGRLAATDVLGRTSLTMAAGGTTAISMRNGAAYINDSRIVATDVDASNGIIHVIDAVLLP